ncbi:16S rRNA (cytosine(1402)-N(4))-methyltransferase RsmH [Helicobacter cholecystus]|uniref:Ribosomal RNA small subunit methyltransferase H n=1 Tax=Helicobacter cholecystus TaxID=45498 RepID=A0A3D8IXW7_9HELI|nr:16S rRNA (cytosine(1402)-N(4))-methyltransferase RsmH [Helicobacter cholecystus]RDU69464.1 16S rRNA (cytosine(1402)-N(4))-methyltransferase RsmH [Helicobacter cholecystus]VEJ24015.1 S-adenosyl-methyltransferase [Helicobacter cholecystus]
MRHIPVLKDQVLKIFSPLCEGTLIDCTLGFGGHTSALLDAHPNLEIIGIDQDKEAREYCKTHLCTQKVNILEGNFADQITHALEIAKKPVVGILADIGVSSLQLDDLSRGFGFTSPTLDMRMDINNPLDASKIINHYSKLQLEKIFREYGEIRESKKMADLIVNYRNKKPFESAFELSSLLEKHFKKNKIHPATLAFQAIRIEVNNELDVLRNLLKSLEQAHIPNAIVAIISFHSLEDRIIKTAFKEWEKNCICPQELMRCECGNTHSRGRILTKKPLVATQEEIQKNPRSRSAKLRAFKFGK